MDFKKGWFAELGTMWPGQAMCLEIEEVLFDQQSKYQHVVVFEYVPLIEESKISKALQCATIATIKH